MLKMRRLFISLGFILSPSILFAGGMPNAESNSNETASSTETQSSGETQSSAQDSTSNNSVSDTSNTSNDTSSNQSASNSGNDTTQSSSNSFIAIEDEPLIIDVSGISDSDGVGKIYVQWQKETSDGRWIDILALHNNLLLQGRFMLVKHLEYKLLF